jgi:hypothetical protein
MNKFPRIVNKFPQIDLTFSRKPKCLWEGQIISAQANKYLRTHISVSGTVIIYFGGYNYSAHCTKFFAHNIYFRAHSFKFPEFLYKRTAILWGKGLEHFQDQYIAHKLDKNGVSFQTMKNHRAFTLTLKGLLVRDEWNVTWDSAENACNKGVRNFIIVGQTGIGVHHFLHIFFLPSADITHQGRPFLFTTFLQCVWPSVSQCSFNRLLTMYGSSTRVGFAPLPVTYDGMGYRTFQWTTLLGPSSIQIRLSKTLPRFYLTLNHLFSSWRHPLLIGIDGLE